MILTLSWSLSVTSIPNKSPLPSSFNLGVTLLILSSLVTSEGILLLIASCVLIIELELLTIP